MPEDQDQAVIDGGERAGRLRPVSQRAGTARHIRAWRWQAALTVLVVAVALVVLGLVVVAAASHGQPAGG
jgi:hypothetical protein